MMLIGGSTPRHRKAVEAAELRVGYTYLERVPLFSLAPGVMITLTVLAFNFVGDGLRDALGPRLRGDRLR